MRAADAAAPDSTEERRLALDPPRGEERGEASGDLEGSHELERECDVCTAGLIDGPGLEAEEEERADKD